jgi:hypothetical protein
MTGSSKFITAQVGAKLVTIELSSPSAVGARKFKADMFGAVGSLVKSLNWGYVLSIDFVELKQAWSCSGSTIAQCTDKFFAELRYQNSLLEAAQIETIQLPADLFQDSEARGEFDLNNHEHDKANW